MSTLDCNTPTGRKFIKSQDLAAKLFAAKYGLDLFQTNPTSSADIDAFFAHDGQLVGIAEIKSRNMTEADLRRFGSYLITHEKIVKGMALSASLQVQFLLIVYLRFDKSMFCWQVTDATGKQVAPFTVEATRTQETCNGGSIVRQNAFFPVEDGKLINLKQA